MDNVKPNYSDRHERGSRIFRSSVYFKIGNEYRYRERTEANTSRPVDVVLPLITKRKLSLRKERPSGTVDPSESSDSTFASSDSTATSTDGIVSEVVSRRQGVGMTTKTTTTSTTAAGQTSISKTVVHTTKTNAAASSGDKPGLSPAFLKAKARFSVKETACDVSGQSRLSSKRTEKSSACFTSQNDSDKSTLPSKPLEKTVIMLSDSGDCRNHVVNNADSVSKVTSMSRVGNDCTKSQISKERNVTNGVTKKSVNDAPPHFIIKPRRQFVNEGSRVTFKTLFQGSPLPRLEWYDGNGKRLETGSQHRMYSANDFCYLELVRATVDDSGTYSCIISNRAGQASHSMELEVYASKKPKAIQPTVTSPLMDVAATCGAHDLVLKCHFKCDIDARVTWYKSGKEISANDDCALNYSKGVATLCIKEVGIGDSGEYKCLLKSTGGEVHTSCNVSVEVNLVEEEFGAVKEPPVFVCELDDLTAYEGDRVELVVEVHGTPPVDVVWVKDNKEIFLDDPDYLQVKQGDVYKLIIEEALIEDTGEFACEAYSDFGDTDTLCYLSVKEQPVKPDFLEKPHSLSTTEGSSIVLKCRVFGIPEPTVHWEKDGIPVKTSPRVQVLLHHCARLL